MVDAGLEDRPVLLFSPYVLEGEDRIPERQKIQNHKRYGRNLLVRRQPKNEPIRPVV
jgi:hypothetical protein